ncbi:hypothetical protein [uncultured Jannaschia sp.]|uniref:hypothetical protein n=1 Tax=uncultured Jannaschia sp. TaxID=293347 RepID=UPI0026221A09|nr:hypothetical protein [uncultured Jannaschia sp.]
MSEFFAAMFGGLIVAGLQLGYQWWNTDRPKKRLEDRQKEMLRRMLTPKNMPPTQSGRRAEWRTFETLKHVIGANDEDTKRLLIEVGARGKNKTGHLWALESNKPLHRSTQDEDSDEVEYEPRHA